jgi:CheY-like chemotaxis protein
MLKYTVREHNKNTPKRKISNDRGSNTKISNLDILLELLGHYDATNGEDALEIAQNEHTDLILLDIMMPDMD